MARPVVDWKRATLVGALGGGVFWGLAAGTIVVSAASATAVTAVCIGAAVVLALGAFIYRRSDSARNRAVGIGLILTPFTGLAPVLAVWLPGLVTHAISWKR
ncbi:outer membrane lipoprotein SlyB [Mycolicibacterium sp. BK556]|nr:outer membrane lipoprotein SlyB [Mycolicibacterium sp. BK556]MBB3635132.1 outer membrane lipoprotein SlyB [Mycolicibacterium sp. BK607]